MKWKNIIDKTSVCATSKSNLATPVEQILNISPSSDNTTPTTALGEETLESYKKRILNSHQGMKGQAEKEYGHPDRYKHVRGAAITHLRPEDLPDLAQYAASPQGITEYHNAQVENNLAKFLEGFSQCQLVMYCSIEEVERDLIPPPLWSYFREYCSIMENQDFQAETNGIPQIGLPPLSAWELPETSPSPLKNAQGLPLPRILALATINMLRDGAKEIYQEENKILRFEFYGLCMLHWEVFSLHNKHWGWALGKYFKVETLLSSARPEVSVHHRANSTYSTEAFEMVKRELNLRVSRGRYVIIRGSPFLSSMTAIPKGDAMPNRNIISRDPQDPAIKALKELPQERKVELQKMDHLLQEIQQRSSDNIHTRSVSQIMSVAYKGKSGVTFQEEVEVRLYGRNGPLTEPGIAPLEREIFPYDLAPGFSTSRTIQRYPGCFDLPLDEEIFAQISWIAGIGTRSRESLLSKGGTHSVALAILRSLPTIRRNL